MDLARLSHTKHYFRIILRAFPNMLVEGFGSSFEAEKLVSTGRGLSKVFARLGGNAVVMAKMLMLSITVHHSHA